MLTIFESTTDPPKEESTREVEMIAGSALDKALLRAHEAWETVVFVSTDRGTSLACKVQSRRFEIPSETVVYRFVKAMIP